MKLSSVLIYNLSPQILFEENSNNNTENTYATK